MAKQIISKPSAFRDIFTFAPSSKDLTRWFPGHMHKGLVKIESMLKNVDCVVEVHDARIPFSGRNTNFRNVMSVRPHLLVLNKADLADLSYREQVDERLKQQGVNAVLYTDCKMQSNTVVKKQLIPTITELIEGAPRYNREETELYNLLVIGVPNVGKSSLINSLRRIHLRKGKATRVGALAGVTRNMQEKVKVCNRPMMYLYDTPGILAPSVKSIAVGLKLALTATMKDHIVGVDTIADYMLYSLNKLENFKYVEYFELPAATDNILDLLAHIAQKYDKVAKVRSANNQGYVYRPHFDAAAVIALQAFRQGKLGHVMLDTDVLRDNKPR